MLMSFKIGLMLHPASHPAYYLPWLPPVAFINSNWGNPSHATTTGFQIGVNLEVIFLVDLRAPARGPRQAKDAYIDGEGDQDVVMTWKWWRKY